MARRLVATVPRRRHASTSGALAWTRLFSQAETMTEPVRAQARQVGYGRLGSMLRDACEWASRAGPSAMEPPATALFKLFESRGVVLTTTDVERLVEEPCQVEETCFDSHGAACRRPRSLIPCHKVMCLECELK